MFHESRIETDGVRSLCWKGDALVDWAGGGASWSLEGRATRARFLVTYRFDAALSSPGGRFTLLYERLGTKAVLFDEWKIIRELNRTFYFADKFDYPALLLDGPDGTALLVHCPRSQSRLEIEDAETGKSLTASAQRKPDEFFHSQLAANPSGTRFLSAGWSLQPEQRAAWFDLADAILEPRTLDKVKLRPAASASRPPRFFSTTTPSCSAAAGPMSWRCTISPPGHRARFRSLRRRAG